MNRKKLQESIVQQGLPILIYGAAASGQVLLHACRVEGIKVSGFCDGNIKKKGTQLMGLDVFHISEVRSKFPKACWLISAADILDIKDILINLGYPDSNLWPGVPLLRDIDLSQFNDFVGYNPEDMQSGFVEFAVKCAIQSQEGYMNPETIFIRSVDLVVTERCSMKCRDCANLMQFFEKPVNYTVENMTKALTALCAFVDEIFEVRVIGGEPFMNKDVHVMIEQLNQQPKVKRIAVYTNATIVPKPHQIECLRNKKVIFMITDYTRCGDGATDEQTARLARFGPTTDQVEKLCVENNIDYRRHPPENWTDAGRIVDFKRGLEGDKKIFRDCCCKNLINLSEDELHRCPFSAQITRLGVSNFESDYVKLSESADRNVMRSQIRNLLHERDVLGACQYCPGRSLSDPQIKPAIQVKSRMQYIKKVVEKTLT